MTTDRPAAVSGTFYPDDADELALVVDRELAAAPRGPRRPKALIAPHAGYRYSGPVAGTAYAAIHERRDEIRRVVVLGPAHRVALRGMAVPSVDRFMTPLGPVALDRQTCDDLAALPSVCVDDQAHGAEHSLEVHLPFLQRLLRAEWLLVPVVVGRVDAGSVADLLDHVWGGPETLIVISTDLSHYRPYSEAHDVDQQTAEAIVGREVDIDPRDACGAYPVAGLLEVARRRGLDVELLDLRNSGDTAGPRDQVVGYGSFGVS